MTAITEKLDSKLLAALNKLCYTKKLKQKAKEELCCVAKTY